MNGACNVKLFWPRPMGPWGGGQKVKYNLISITKSISKICVPKFVCVLTNERYKTYQTVFSFCCLGHAPGVGLWGDGVPRGSKIILFQTWSCAYQIDGDDEQNGTQVKFLSYDQTVDLGLRSKGQISLNFDYHFNSKIFIPIFVCVFTDKR